MKTLNVYIVEAWSGVKKQSYEQEIKSWCDEMKIENYTINSQGEIDVKGSVDLDDMDFEELPYKFGKVTKYFELSGNKNLISLKNCPNKIGKYFSCSNCPKLDSLKGCPNYVEWNFYCYDCKREFTEKEVKALCKINGKINI